MIDLEKKMFPKAYSNAAVAAFLQVKPQMTKETEIIYYLELRAAKFE